MTLDDLRFRYGRGAARLLVSVPEPGFETVPSSTAGILVGRLGHLSLALALAMSLVLLSRQTPVTPLPAAPVAVSYWAPGPESAVLSRAPADSFALDATVVDSPAEPVLPDLGPVHEEPAAREVAERAAIVRDLPRITTESIGIDPVAPAPELHAPRRGVAARRRAVGLPPQTASTAPRIANIAAVAGPAVAVQIASLPPVTRRRSLDALPAVSSGPREVAGVAAPESIAPEFAPEAIPAIEHQFHTPTQDPAIEIPEFPIPDLASDPGLGSADGIRGVRLESLPVCRSRNREDALKLQLLAEAGSRESCANDTGQYNFLETKNLNAFLMRVSRAQRGNLAIVATN